MNTSRFAPSMPTLFFSSGETRKECAIVICLSDPVVLVETHHGVTPCSPHAHHFLPKAPWLSGCTLMAVRGGTYFTTRAPLAVSPGIWVTSTRHHQPPWPHHICFRYMQSLWKDTRGGFILLLHASGYSQTNLLIWVKVSLGSISHPFWCHWPWRGWWAWSAVNGAVASAGLVSHI